MKGERRIFDSLCVKEGRVLSDRERVIVWLGRGLVSNTEGFEGWLKKVSTGGRRLPLSLFVFLSERGRWACANKNSFPPSPPTPRARVRPLSGVPCSHTRRLAAVPLADDSRLVFRLKNGAEQMRRCPATGCDFCVLPAPVTPAIVDRDGNNVVARRDAGSGGKRRANRQTKNKKKSSRARGLHFVEPSDQLFASISPPLFPRLTTAWARLPSE